MYVKKTNNIFRCYYLLQHLFIIYEISNVQKIITKNPYIK